MAAWLCKHHEACLRGWVLRLWQQDKEVGRVMSYRHVLDMFPLRLLLSMHWYTFAHEDTQTHRNAKPSVNFIFHHLTGILDNKNCTSLLNYKLLETAAVLLSFILLPFTQQITSNILSTNTLRCFVCFCSHLSDNDTDNHDAYAFAFLKRKMTHTQKTKQKTERVLETALHRWGFESHLQQFLCSATPIPKYYPLILGFKSCPSSLQALSAAGLGSGLTEAVVVNPFEVVKVSLQANRDSFKEVEWNKIRI